MVCDLRIFLMGGIALGSSERHQFKVYSFGNACVLEQGQQFGFEKPGAFRVLGLKVDVHTNSVGFGVGRLKIGEFGPGIKLEYFGKFGMM